MRNSSISAQKIAPPRPRQTKALKVERLLKRNQGATLSEIATSTNWQPHSCRSFLTGLRKRGLTILKESRNDGATNYRIES